MMATIDISGKGRRRGDLTEQYRIGKRVACRCRCTRLVFFNTEELATATSCGCSPPSLARVAQLKRLGAELQRAIQFNIARAR
jgi:hypothetical protein